MRFQFKKYLYLFFVFSIIFFLRPKHVFACNPVDYGGAQLCADIIGDPAVNPSSLEYFELKFKITMSDPQYVPYVDAISVWYTKTEDDGRTGWTTPIQCTKTNPAGSSIFKVSNDQSFSNTDLNTEVTYSCYGAPYADRGQGYIRLAYCNKAWNGVCDDNEFPTSRGNLSQLKAIPYNFSQNGSLVTDGTVNFKSCVINQTSGKAELSISKGLTDPGNRFFLRAGTGTRDGYFAGWSGNCIDGGDSSLDWKNGAAVGPFPFMVDHPISCELDGLVDAEPYYFHIVKNDKENGQVEAYCAFTKYEGRFVQSTKDQYSVTPSGSTKNLTINTEFLVLPLPRPSGAYKVKIETESGQEISSCLLPPVSSGGRVDFNCDMSKVPGGPAGSEKFWRMSLWSPDGRNLTPGDKRATVKVLEAKPDEASTGGSCECTMSGSCSMGHIPATVTTTITRNYCFSGRNARATGCLAWTYQCICSCFGATAFDLGDQATNPNTGLPNPKFNLNDFAGWMGNLHNYLIAIGVILSVFMLPWGFVLLGTGDPGNIKKGQEILQSLAIGLVVLILSGTIIRLISSEVLGL